MGSGYFNQGKFHFTVTANFTWTPQKKAQWQSAFILASQALYDATEGQLQLGEIFLADQGWAPGEAEAILNEIEGRAYATLGKFGHYGEALHLFDQASNPGGHTTIVHELGHHILALGDEYTKEVLEDEIDTEVTPQNEFFVPLVNSPHNSEELEFANAIIMFGNVLVTRIVKKHTPTMLEVFGGFSHPLDNAAGNRVFYQRFATCAEQANTNYCLMDNHTDKTEFCTEANHDPGQDTYHSALYAGKSCWDIIKQTMENRWDFEMDVPEVAQSGPTTSEYPVFYDLEKEYRVVLALDRSGSMIQGNKMDGVRFGVEWWLRYASIHSDPNLADIFKIGVLWYSSDVNEVLPMTLLSQNQALEDAIDNVHALQPAGWTNIRDALYTGRDMIEGEGGRAAVQAIILMTDGIHNWTPVTQAQEAIPALQQASIPVFSLGVGQTQNVDLDLLEELSESTGGYAIENVIGQGPSTQVGAIAVEFGMLLHKMLNGLTLNASGTIGAAPPDHKAFERFKTYLGRGNKPSLNELMDFLEANDLKELISDPLVSGHRTLVEENAQAFSAQVFPMDDHKVWLYLVDPDGNPSSGDKIKGFTTKTGSSETSRVTEPAAGFWHVLAVRTAPGPEIPVRILAGVENRTLVAFGDMDKQVPVNGALRITAGASWNDRLSGLRVAARITAPDGTLHQISLSDERRDEPNSGEYTGVIHAGQPGRWRGEILIAGNKRSILAAPIRRMMHGPIDKKEGASMNLKSGTTSFMRRIPVYADVGDRPGLVDLEKDGRHPLPDKERPPKRKLKPLDVKEARRIVEGAKK